MLAEAKISNLMDSLSLSDVERIKQSLIKAELPIITSGVDINKVFNKIQSDKKNEKGKVNFTLLQEIGKAVYNQNVPDEVIIQALKYVTK
jgi:3-dehydroquinate synthase